MAIAVFANAEGRSARQTLLAGIAEAARERNRPLVLFSSPTVNAFAKLDQSEIEKAYSFRPDDFAGVIMAYPHERLMAYGESLHRQGYPVVFVARPGPVPSVTVDNFAAVRRITAAFIAAGHRSVAFLAGPRGNASAEARREGFVSAVRADASRPPPLVLPGEFSTEAGYAAVRETWRQGERFTALVAANDASAIGALRALQELGVDVPAEVEVVGFDDLPPAKWTTPTLASFAPPEFEMGRRAGVHLLDRQPGEIVLPVSFVRRASVRPTTVVEGETTALLCASEAMASPELTVIRANRPAATFLAKIEAAAPDAPSLAVDTPLLIDACERLDVNPACLQPLLREKSSTARSAPLAVLQEAIFEAQRRPAEIASEFDVILRPLRQSIFEVADERLVLATLRRTLDGLGVRRGTLFLRLLTSSGALEPDYTLAWQSGPANTEPPDQASKGSFRIADYLSGPAIRRGYFVSPLLQNHEQFGLLVLDLDNRYRAMYPDLARQLTTAVQSARSSVLLTRAHQALVESSHSAGMAEVAAGVLHNVGNVLNSLNVSASLISDGVHRLKTESLGKVAGLLDEHRADLGTYLTEDAKGKRLPELITRLAAAFTADRDRILAELETVRASIDQIKAVVSAQQAFATTARVVEEIEAKSLAEDALRMNATAVMSHGVQIVREFAETPPVRAERAKALQVLVSLIKNALQACAESGRAEKRVVVRIGRGHVGCVRFEVRDNGVGIAAGNLTRIFSHGFSTRSGAHGFSLHFAALAAKEMSGTLTVESAGLGDGANFVLELPESQNDARLGT